MGYISLLSSVYTHKQSIEYCLPKFNKTHINMVILLCSIGFMYSTAHPSYHNIQLWLFKLT